MSSTFLARFKLALNLKGYLFFVSKKIDDLAESIAVESPQGSDKASERNRI